MSGKIIPFYDHSSSDERPLPERLIDQIGGTMDYIDTPTGKRLYSVRDWVYWVSGSEAKQKHKPWADLKRSLAQRGNFKVVEILDTLDIDTAGGKQKTDFTDEHGLYLITQRMSDNSEFVRGVKKYLADAGVFVDAIHRDVQHFAKLGRSDSWIEERIRGKVTRNRFTAALKRALAEFDPNIYAHATDEMYRALWKRTTAELRRDLKLAEGQTPRDYMGEFALIYTRLTEMVCTKRLGDSNEIAYLEAIEIVKEVARLYHRQAKETSEALGIDLVTGKKLLPPQSPSIA